MPRGRAPPFNRRVQAALDAARTAGVARVKVTDRDGASFDFDLKSIAPDDLNDFDAIPPKPLPPRKNQKR
jgi:hypothetical protein